MLGLVWPYAEFGQRGDSFSIGRPTTFVNEHSIFAMIYAPPPCAM